MEAVTVLIEQAHKGDKEARDQLVANNIGLVWSIVRRFLNRGCEAEDLFQIGSIGLMKAIDKFDTGYEVKFSTYAVPMIAGEIRRFLRDDGMLKVSRTIREHAGKVQSVRQRLQATLNREPTVGELSAETGSRRRILCWRWILRERWNPFTRRCTRGTGPPLPSSTGWRRSGMPMRRC